MVIFSCSLLRMYSLIKISLGRKNSRQKKEALYEETDYYKAEPKAIIKTRTSIKSDD